MNWLRLSIKPVFARLSGILNGIISLMNLSIAPTRNRIDFARQEEVLAQIFALQSQLAERDAKPNTIRTRKSQMARLRRSFSGPAAKVGTLEVSNAIKAMKDEGKHRAAQAFRSFLIDCFEDDDLAVRQAAKDAIERVLNQKVAFDPAAPAPDRTKAADALRKKLAEKK